MNFWTILYIIDLLCFFVVAVTVIYLFVYTVGSLLKRHNVVINVKRQNRFIVIIPAYKDDEEIENTVQSILGQSYPQRLFDVTVVSDHEDELTNIRLAQYPITLLTPDFDVSSKIRSLQLAIKNLPAFKIYDIVLILDSGNLVDPDFLEQVNDAYEISGTRAIQFHRLARNRDSGAARLDAIFEEINNTIFRKGHVALNISAALGGSGYIIEFSWFKDHIAQLSSAWEDKELEILLLRDDIFIDYFNNIYVYDIKTRSMKEFNLQRRRWIASQFHSLFANVRYLPYAFVNKRYDVIDKIFQWLLVPRLPMMAIIGLMSIALPLIYFSLVIKWWILAAIVMFVFAVATPDYLVDKYWNKTFIINAPRLLISSLINIAHIGYRQKKTDVSK